MGIFSIASQHIRFAVKLACAIVLALFVGFHFQLETPRWAVLTAAIVAAGPAFAAGGEPYSGAIRYRGMLRIIGTFIGCFAALTIIILMIRTPLLMLMVFPLLALLFWLPQWRTTQSTTISGSGAAHNRGIWRSTLAWQVTLFLGLNSLVYYVIIGWLPAILISQGYSEAQAGSLHGLLQLATAVPGFVVPLILLRLKDQRGIAILSALMCAVSMLGYILLPAQAVIWTVMYGLGSGATMILGLTFIGLRASSAHQAAALSGMAQTVGYLLAACGPPLMGKMHDASGSWHISLFCVAALALVMAVFGGLAGRDREINAG